EGAGEAGHSFAALRELVSMPGGRGKLSAAREVMEELGLHQIATFGLAKRKEELYQIGSPRPLLLDPDSAALFLLERVRDEAHRFAVSFHRRVRTKGRLASPLDAVAGLGPKRKRQLIKRFRSIAGVRQASIEQLSEV